MHYPINQCVCSPRSHAASSWLARRAEGEGAGGVREGDQGAPRPPPDGHHVARRAPESARHARAHARAQARRAVRLAFDACALLVCALPSHCSHLEAQVPPNSAPLELYFEWPSFSKFPSRKLPRCTCVFMCNLEARELGRRDVRRGASLPARVSLGTSRDAAQTHSQHPIPDAPARRQRRRIHQLS